MQKIWVKNLLWIKSYSLRNSFILKSVYLNYVTPCISKLLYKGGFNIWKGFFWELIPSSRSVWNFFFCCLFLSADKMIPVKGLHFFFLYSKQGEKLVKNSSLPRRSTLLLGFLQMGRLYAIYVALPLRNIYVVLLFFFSKPRGERKTSSASILLLT